MKRRYMLKNMASAGLFLGGAILGLNHSSKDAAWPFPEVIGGYALPTDKPGLGVTINEEAAAAIPFNNNSMQPRLNGYDGSVRDF